METPRTASLSLLETIILTYDNIVSLTEQYRVYVESDLNEELNHF